VPRAKRDMALGLLEERNMSLAINHLARTVRGGISSLWPKQGSAAEGSASPDRYVRRWTHG
jgi:hypothetical protein